jgi:DNA polymerase I-like protein with 3'-5' exonuclease and polymerase domains
MLPSIGLEPVIPFFSDPAWLKIIHNAAFDTQFLKHYYGNETRNVFDTMLAEELLTTDRTGVANLAAVTYKYTGISLDKTIRESFYKNGTIKAFTNKQLAYAAEDSEVLLAIYEKQKKALEENGLSAIADIEFDLAPIVGDMELVGVPVDVKKWRIILDKYREQHEQSRLRMHEILFDDGGLQEQMGMFVRDSINLGSPKQLMKALTAIGIDLENTAERELQLIDHPAAKELLNYRKTDKIMNAYGESFLAKIHPFSGRIHADFKQIGTATGRFSCRNPNLQQMPQEFRECVSLEDHKIVVADYPNIELRILAELSGDEMLSQAFSTGQDPHKSTASLMFNIPLDKVSKEQRFIAKTINFGISYGMGTDKLKDMLNAERPLNQQLSFGQVQSIMTKYKKTYKRAADWLAETGNLSYRRGYSETMLGRRRILPRPLTPGDDDAIAALKRKGANSPIQGTNADITKIGMVNLYNELQSYYPGAKMILQVHDEVAVLAHKREADGVKEVVEESLTASAQQLLKKTPVKVEAVISDVWKKD